MEEALLDGLLPPEELDVVHQEDVNGPVSLAKLTHPLRLQGGDEVVRELLGAHVQARKAPGRGSVAYAVQQVRLAKPNAAVQEERIVGRAGPAGDRHCRGIGQLVGLAHHEGAERVTRVEREAASKGRCRRFVRLVLAAAGVVVLCGRRGIGARWRPGNAESHRGGTARDLRKRGLNERRHSLLEPAGREWRCRLHHHPAVVKGDARGVPEPGGKAWFADLQLQAAQDGLPNGAGTRMVQRSVASALPGRG